MLSREQIVNIQELGVLYFEEGRGFSLKDLDKRMHIMEQQSSGMPQADKLIPYKFKPKKIGWSQQSFEQAMQGATAIAPDDYIRLPAFISAKDYPTLLPNTFKRATLIDNQGGDALFKFPNLAVYDKLPSYIPKYLVEDPDQDLFRFGMDLLVHSPAPPKVKQLVTSAMIKAVQTTQQYYLGNGSVHGQIGRHKKVLAVRDRMADLRQRFPKQLLTPDQLPAWVKMMNKRYPLRKVDFHLDKLPTSLIIAWEDSKPSSERIISIVPTSDAGFPWSKGSGKVVRQTVVGQDLDLADTMYRSCSKMGGQGDLSIKTSEFWRTWSWARLAKMKPKTEVYTIEEYNEKTRNIQAVCSGTQMMGQMILLPTHHKTLTFLDDPEVWNMIGWTPYHGGMTRTMTTIMQRGLSFRAVYADNVYLVVRGVNDKPLFLSLDGEKMEASITPQDIAAEMIRSLKHFSSSNPSWQMYATQVFPNLGWGLHCVLGGNQIYTPYMGSGIQGTAYFNCSKSTRFLDRWMELDPDPVMEEDLVPSGMRRAGDETGCSFKVESMVYLDHMDHNLVNDEIPMDLLGFSAYECTDLGLPGEYIAVLERERLYKGISFMKMHFGKDTPPIIKYGMLLFRLRAFYFLGAWKEVGLSEWVQYSCLRLATATENLSMFDWDAQWQEIASSVGIKINFDNEDYKDFLAVKGLPTLYEVVKLHLGKDAAKRFVEHIMSTQEEPWGFMPYEIFEENRHLTDKTPPEHVKSRLSQVPPPAQPITQPIRPTPISIFPPPKQPLIKESPILGQWEYLDEGELSEAPTPNPAKPPKPGEKLSQRNPWRGIMLKWYKLAPEEDKVELKILVTSLMGNHAIPKGEKWYVKQQQEDIQDNTPPGKRASELLGTVTGIPSILLLPYVVARGVEFANQDHKPNSMQVITPEYVQSIRSDVALPTLLELVKRMKDKVAEAIKLSPQPPASTKEPPARPKSTPILRPPKTDVGSNVQRARTPTGKRVVLELTPKVQTFVKGSPPLSTPAPKRESKRKEPELPESSDEEDESQEEEVIMDEPMAPISEAEAKALIEEQEEFTPVMNEGIYQRVEPEMLKIREQFPSIKGSTLLRTFDSTVNKYTKDMDPPPLWFMISPVIKEGQRSFRANITSFKPDYSAPITTQQTISFPTTFLETLAQDTAGTPDSMKFNRFRNQAEQAEIDLEKNIQILNAAFTLANKNVLGMKGSSDFSRRARVGVIAQALRGLVMYLREALAMNSVVVQILQQARKTNLSERKLENMDKDSLIRERQKALNDNNKARVKAIDVALRLWSKRLPG